MIIFAEKVRKIVHCVFTLGWHKLDKTQEHSRKLYPMVSVFLPLRGCGLLGWTNVSLVSGSFRMTVRRAQVLFNKEGIIHELLVEAPLIRFSRMPLP